MLTERADCSFYTKHLTEIRDSHYFYDWSA